MRDITVKIKLRNGELFIFKEHARAFDVASRVHARPPPTTAVAARKERKMEKKIEGSRDKAEADVTVLNKRARKTYAERTRFSTFAA